MPVQPSGPVFYFIPGRKAGKGLDTYILPRRLYHSSLPPLLAPALFFSRSFSSVAAAHSFTMVGVNIILLFAAAIGFATANPLRLGLRQSGASTASPPWYPSRTFFSRFLPGVIYYLREVLTRYCSQGRNFRIVGAFIREGS